MNSFWLNVFKVVNKFLIVAIVCLCFASSNKGLGYAKECNHSNITFGRAVYGQTLVNDTIIRSPKTLLGGHDINFKHPWKSSAVKYNISQVIIMNLYKGCDCTKDSAKIKSGGIGKSDIEVKVAPGGYYCDNYRRFLVYNNTRSIR